MPELPEVETIRRQLEPAVSGRTVVEAGSHPSAKFTPARAAVGATIERVGRRGKFLLLGTTDDRELVIHLGMTGQLRVGEPTDDPYIRAWWTLDNEQTLEFRDVRRFGRIRLGPAGQYQGILAKIGPEPFDPVFTGQHLYAAINGSKRQLKTQLLSQHPVAGVGNIYADEACWRAGVHPGVRRITKKQAAALRDAIVDVLDEGIEHGGTTLRDYRTMDGGYGENQNRLECYGRYDQPCPRCNTIMKKLVLDARTTTFCPTCQAR